MYKKLGLPYLPGKIRSLIRPVSPTLIDRAGAVGNNLKNSLNRGLRCYHKTESLFDGTVTFCAHFVFVEGGSRFCPVHGKLKCGNQLNRWGYCELPWGHSGSCEFDRINYSNGGDDRSPYGPD